jgi:hypothetical protein
MGWYSDKYYSRDGDQLCSNVATVFAVCALCVGLVPQVTCSFLSINPAEVLSYPMVWPPQFVVDAFPNTTNKTDLIEGILNGSIPIGGDVVATGDRAEENKKRKVRPRRWLAARAARGGWEPLPEAAEEDGNPFADRLAFAPTYLGRDWTLQHRNGLCPRPLPGPAAARGHNRDDPRRQRDLQFVDDMVAIVEDVVPGDGDASAGGGEGGGSSAPPLPPIPGLPSFGGISPSESLLDQVGFGQRNITATTFTVNAGPWRFGVYQIDGRCYPMDDNTVVETSLRVARATGIVASVAGFAGIVLAMTNCHLDDKTRRHRNKFVAALYLLAAVSTFLTFFIYNITACQGKRRMWDAGPLDGLVLLYGKCQCRAGCFLTIVAGCCYLAAVGTVLIYSG